MRRLLVIDLDDTLLTSSHDITQYTFDVLHKAVKAGMILVIATGRVPYMLPAVVERLPLNGPLITSNGAIVVDAHTHDVLSEQLIPVDRVIVALERIRHFKLSYCYYARERMYVESTMFNGFEKQKARKHSRVAKDDILDLHLQPCIKLAVYSDAGSLREERREFEQLFAGHLYITQTSPICLEFLHPEVSKANALKKVMHTLGIKAEEVIAFGDNHNDIEMLRLAGMGVAMGNAEIEVKAVADYVTLSNNEDGVATALEKILFPGND